MCCGFDSLILICEIPSGIQGGRTLHDQATMLELRIMLSEMKELLNQQVKKWEIEIVQYVLENQ